MNKRHMKVYRVEIKELGGDYNNIYIAAPNLDAVKGWLLDYVMQRLEGPAERNVQALSIFCIKGMSFFTEKTCQITLENGVWQYGTVSYCLDQAPDDLDNQWHPNAY